MLSITRKDGEAVVIQLEDGRTITIHCRDRTDYAAHRTKFALGFEAPTTVRIDRMEVYESRMRDQEIFGPLLDALLIVDEPATK